jgi:hypothetical protein
MGTSHASIAPDVVLVEVAQAVGVEAEGGVFGDVAARAESLALAFDEHAAHAGAALDVFEDGAQLAPHAARHGVEPPLVAQHHAHHATAGRLSRGLGRPHFTCHISFPRRYARNR